MWMAHAGKTKTVGFLVDLRLKVRFRKNFGCLSRLGAIYTVLYLFHHPYFKKKKIEKAPLMMHASWMPL